MAHALSHRFARHCLLAAAASAVVAGAAPASAQPSARDGDAAAAVVAIVKVPMPWYAPRAIVAGRMRDSMPQYDSIPGLAYKAFSFARPGGQYGGLYYWKDRASADAWFDAAWFARVEKERGAKPGVLFLDAPVAIDNTPGGTPLASDGPAVGVLVAIVTPAGVGRERLVAEFRAAVPVYRRIDGLLRKYFTIGADGTFGGVYLWRDQAAADRWFDAAWHERVKKTYGTPARIEWFDTPILLPAKAAANRIDLSVAQP